ncbi:MAG TPA: hypothetical protein VMH41_12580 [Mycobacteriales bacterium]|nr:hypothetical protein [Mycobacteriales bacterium]
MRKTSFERAEPLGDLRLAESVLPLTAFVYPLTQQRGQVAASKTRARELAVLRPPMRDEHPRWGVDQVPGREIAGGGSQLSHRHRQQPGP